MEFPFLKELLVQYDLDNWPEIEVKVSRADFSLMRYEPRSMRPTANTVCSWNDPSDGTLYAMTTHEAVVIFFQKYCLRSVISDDWQMSVCEALKSINAASVDVIVCIRRRELYRYDKSRPNCQGAFVKMTGQVEIYKEPRGGFSKLVKVRFFDPSVHLTTQGVNEFACNDLAGCEYEDRLVFLADRICAKLYKAGLRDLFKRNGEEPWEQEIAGVHVSLTEFCGRHILKLENSDGDCIVFGGVSTGDYFSLGWKEINASYEAALMMVNKVCEIWRMHIEMVQIAGVELGDLSALRT